MIVLRTQLNHSFDREFVFTALHKRFTFVHLFYSHLTCTIKPFPFRSIPRNHSLSTKRRFAGSACTAPTEGPPPSYLQHWSPSLFELINGLGFHSGHTIADNGFCICSVHVLTTFLKLRKIPKIWNTRFELTVGRRKTCMESYTLLSFVSYSP